MSSDYFLNDPLQVGITESGGIVNLKGTVGDRLVGGQALPLDPTLGGNITQTRMTTGSISNRTANENYVLRFSIDGNGGGNAGDELVVNIYNQWNAVGRIYASRARSGTWATAGSGRATRWRSRNSGATTWVGSGSAAAAPTRVAAWRS